MTTQQDINLELKKIQLMREQLALEDELRKRQRRAAVHDSVVDVAGGSIWSPNAAVGWSLLFSPAFGSYLHAVNWGILGEPEREKSAMRWFYFSIAVLVVSIFLPDRAEPGLSIIYWVVWYSAAGQAQAKYVKEKFGPRYPRRSWAKPLLIGVVALLGYGLFVAGAESVIR